MRQEVPKELDRRVYFDPIDKNSRLPRFHDLTAPLCPNCTQSDSRKVLMTGPQPDPTGKSKDPIFICRRCQATMKDRRKTKRDGPGPK